MLHLFYSSHPIDRNLLKQQSLCILSLQNFIEQSLLENPSSSLLRLKSPLTHLHFLELVLVAQFAVVVCFSVVWGFLSPALDIELHSSEVLSESQGAEIFYWDAVIPHLITRESGTNLGIHYCLKSLIQGEENSS